MILQRIFYGLFPPKCFVCGSAYVTHSNLCYACHQKIQFVDNYCEYCALELMVGQRCPNCLNGNDAIFERYVLGYHYHSVIRDIITNLKFKHQMYLVRVIQELLEPLVTRYEFVFNEIDYIVPMPVDRIRLAGRGFNHMLEISNVLQTIIQTPIIYDRLYKRAFSIPQSDLSRQERLENLNNMLISRPISGNILLVDDVFTTGQTLHYAGLALKKAGASKVIALVLAKA